MTSPLHFLKKNLGGGVRKSITRKVRFLEGAITENGIKNTKKVVKSNGEKWSNMVVKGVFW